jgi:hypothetical protein
VLELEEKSLARKHLLHSTFCQHHVWKANAQTPDEGKSFGEQ